MTMYVLEELQEAFGQLLCELRNRYLDMYVR
jgi:hypothetical protein